VAFTRWDPLHDLLAIQRHLDRFAPGPAAGWIPSVDLIETADEYVMTAELPGVRQEDVQIEMHDGRLTLSGSRREPAGPCEQHHRMERGYGPFRRTFHLPVPVDATRIAADLRDGVLTVTCPKTPSAVTRRVPIA
jgi:HSP20 family protein